MALRKIGHFNIDIANIDESKKFYCDILGLVDGKRSPPPFPGAWLYGEDGSPMVHLSDVLPTDQRHSAPTGLLNPASETRQSDRDALAAKLDVVG